MPTHPILMIQTRNKRKYFTEAKNLPMLVEFAKTFGAELSLVEAAEIAPLKLDGLAPAMCDESYRTPRQSRKAKLLRRIYPQTGEYRKDRRSMIENARLIRQFIRDRLEAGHVLRVKEVKAKFSDLSLSDSCISNHIAAVRREMQRSGLDVARIKVGSYRLS